MQGLSLKPKKTEKTELHHQAKSKEMEGNHIFERRHSFLIAQSLTVVNYAVPAAPKKPVHTGKAFPGSPASTQKPKKEYEARRSRVQSARTRSENFGGTSLLMGSELEKQSGVKVRD